MTDNSIPSLPPLNLPVCSMQFRNDAGKVKVFDPLRRKFVAFTPEEYVRQSFTNHLVANLHYPASVTANEIQIQLNGTQRRCDTVVFGPDRHPLMIVEYKAPEIRISQQVFDQIVRYNMVLQASYLTVSNGLDHFCCRMDYDNGAYAFLHEIPDYRDITRRHDTGKET